MDSNPCHPFFFQAVASNENSKADDVAICHANEPRDEQCDAE